MVLDFTTLVKKSLTIVGNAFIYWYLSGIHWNLLNLRSVLCFGSFSGYVFVFTIVNLSVLCIKSDFFRLKIADLLIFSCVFIYKGLPLQ